MLSVFQDQRGDSVYKGTTIKSDLNVGTAPEKHEETSSQSAARKPAAAAQTRQRATHAVITSKKRLKIEIPMQKLGPTSRTIRIIFTPIKHDMCDFPPYPKFKKGLGRGQLSSKKKVRECTKTDPETSHRVSSVKIFLNQFNVSWCAWTIGNYAEYTL